MIDPWSRPRQFWARNSASPPPPKVVFHTQLLEWLNERLRVSAGGTPRVTLISVPAGFGKSTLVSEWVASPWHRAALRSGRAGVITRARQLSGIALKRTLTLTQPA